MAGEEQMLAGVFQEFEARSLGLGSAQVKADLSSKESKAAVAARAARWRDEATGGLEAAHKTHHEELILGRMPLKHKERAYFHLYGRAMSDSRTFGEVMRGSAAAGAAPDPDGELDDWDRVAGAVATLFNRQRFEPGQKIAAAGCAPRWCVLRYGTAEVLVSGQRVCLLHGAKGAVEPYMANEGAGGGSGGGAAARQARQQLFEVGMLAPGRFVVDGKTGASGNRGAHSGARYDARFAAVRAVTPCVVGCLLRRDFENALRMFPRAAANVRAHVEREARRRAEAEAGARRFETPLPPKCNTRSWPNTAEHGCCLAPPAK